MVHTHSQGLKDCWKYLFPKYLDDIDFVKKYYIWIVTASSAQGPESKMSEQQQQQW